MSGLFLLLRLVLSATFAVAGITKLKDPAGTRQSVLDFGAPAWSAAIAARLLPLAELLCALALLLSATAVWGAEATLALLLIFIAAIAASLARGKHPACHCFGQLHSEPVGWTTIVRNVALSAAAVAVILRARIVPPESYPGWLGGLDRFGLAALGFSLIIVLLAAGWLWSFVHLLRQNGRLLVRVEALETELGIRPAPPEPGLPVGTPAPPFRLAALDGSVVTLDSLRRLNETVLLVFSEPGCTGCDALMPDVARWQREHAERFAVAIVSQGALDANRAKAAEHSLQNYLLQKDEEASHAYQAEGTPTAVLIRNGHIASAVASGLDAVHALAEKALEPPPLGRGEIAPDVTLIAANGGSISPAKLAGPESYPPLLESGMWFLRVDARRCHSLGDQCHGGQSPSVGYHQRDRGSYIGSGVSGSDSPRCRVQNRSVVRSRRDTFRGSAR